MTTTWEDELEDAIAALESADAQGVPQILENWVETVAPLGADEEVTAMQEDYAFKQLAEKSGMTKTAIKQTYQQAVQQVQQQRGSPLNNWLEKHVEEVVTLRPTDAHQGTCWEWYLDTDDGVAFETSVNNGNVAHFAHNILTTLIYETTGEIVDAPEEGIRDGDAWKRWIQNFITKNGRVEEVVGPRTQTTEALLDYVQRTPAHTEIDAAAARDDLYVDQQDNTLYVPSRKVQKLCDDNGITPTALQTELDARGLLVDEVSGASVKRAVTVDDERRSRRWWVLDLAAENVPEPSELNPVSPAAQAETELGVDETDTATDGADATDESGDGEPEIIEKVSLNGGSAGGDDESE